MAECEALGREIGLPKRVVQVWFQNARAKEKKNKLNAQKAAGDLSGVDNSITKQPEGCDLCEFKYSHKYAVQDHIFTHQHIERVKIHVAEQSGKHGDELPPATARSKSTQQQQQLDEPSTSSTPTPVGSGGNDEASPLGAGADSAQLEALLLHQLYGLGYGAGGMPAAALAAAAAAASTFGNQQASGPAAMMWAQSGENYLLTMLQRSPAALQQIAKTFSESGVSEARFTLDGSTRSTLADNLNPSELKLIRTHSTDVGVLCKACQTLYGSEAAVVQHQRTGCPQSAESSASSGGATRLVLLQHECMACEERSPTLGELQSHLRSDPHRRIVAKLSGTVLNGDALASPDQIPPPTSSSPSGALTSQIEDVVKQLTALAQATGPNSTVAPSFGGKNNSSDCDTNANIAQRKAATYGQ